MHQSMSIRCAKVQTLGAEKNGAPTLCVLCTVYAVQSELTNDVQVKFVFGLVRVSMANWQRELPWPVIILIPEHNNNLGDTIYPRRARAHVPWRSTKAGKVRCLTTKKFSIHKGCYAIRTGKKRRGANDGEWQSIKRSFRVASLCASSMEVKLFDNGY